jgi:hypothetical protein
MWFISSGMGKNGADKKAWTFENDVGRIPVDHGWDGVLCAGRYGYDP